MNVKLDFGKSSCTVTKEPGDKTFYRTGWALPESGFLYEVLKELKKQGYDVIKKRAWKDGNLVDDTMQYIRDRKGKFCIYNSNYAIYDAGEKFNERGIIVLAVGLDK